MDKLKSYIKEILGTAITEMPHDGNTARKLPLYLKDTFRFDFIGLYNQAILLAEVIHSQHAPTIGQLEKQLAAIQQAFDTKPVLVIEDISSIDRKRLIQKGINFIVPEKQLFLPDFLIDLREYNKANKTKTPGDKLLPSAQYILLYQILNRYDDISQYSFKQLAEKLNYTQMAVSNAADDLKKHDLCRITGSKEKYIHLDRPIPELWHEALPYLVNPVLKMVYVDELPAGLFLYHSNMSALAEYTAMAPGRQEYLAIEKNLFYGLLKSKQWINPNEREGRYCLEIWKYNPEKLAENTTEESSVDPLSLYLSLKESTDERVEMALEQILEKFIW